MATRNADETDAQIGRCNSRFNILDGKLDALAIWKGRADMEIETALSGVSNFRDFQSDARDFFSRTDERAKTEKLFHEQRDKEIKDALLAQQNTVKLALGNDNIKTAKRSLVWQIAGVFISVAAVCVAVLAIICASYVSRHSSIEPPDLLRTLHTERVLTAHNSQDAAAGRASW